MCVVPEDILEAGCPTATPTPRMWQGAEFLLSLLPQAHSPEVQLNKTHSEPASHQESIVADA